MSSTFKCSHRWAQVPLGSKIHIANVLWLPSHCCYGSSWRLSSSRSDIITKSLYRGGEGWRPNAQEICVSWKWREASPGGRMCHGPYIFFAPPMDVCQALIRRKSHFVNATNPLEFFLNIRPLKAKFDFYVPHAFVMRPMEVCGGTLSGPSLLAGGD